MTSDDKRKQYFEEHPEVYKQYKEIKTINELPGNSFTEEKLKEIKEYAIEHTKFYQNYSVDDDFPVMTKLDFINHHNELLSDENFKDELHISSTSGSTGIPFKVEQNKEKRDRNIADLKVYGEYAGFKSHEKMIQLRSYGGRDLDRTVDEKENIWRYDIFGMTSEKISKFVDFVLEYKPIVIFSYVGALVSICDDILASKKEYDFGVKSILVGAEALTEEAYQKIFNVFKCPVYDRYSNMEMGIYAQREYGKTAFRINKASYYFECLKLDSDEKVAEGELGRIVFTDLANHAFPMIRYDTGDLGTYKVVNDEVYIDVVYGRRLDQIYNSKGEIVNPHDISRMLQGIKGIAQWQLIQNDLEVFTFKYVVDGESVDMEDILFRLKSILGTSVKFDMEEKKEIPVLGSQKRKAIVNEMNK